MKESGGVGEEALEASWSLLARNAIWDLLGCGAPPSGGSGGNTYSDSLSGHCEVRYFGVRVGCFGYFGFLKVALDFAFARLLGKLRRGRYAVAIS
jgi:hypothetical protein